MHDPSALQGDCKFLINVLNKMAQRYLTMAQLEAIVNESDFFDDIEDEIQSANESEVLEDNQLNKESLSSSNLEQDDDNTTGTLRAKNVTICSKSKPRVSRRSSKNILRQKPGRKPRRKCCTAGTIHNPKEQQ
jgi:hypothetical protein